MRSVNDMLFWSLMTLVVFAKAQTASYDSAISLASASTSTTLTAESTSSTASSTTRDPTTRTVSVGYAGFTFQPDVTLANVGDTIEFDFYPTNHSVVRSLYGYPCVPYEMTGIDRVGFFSGFKIADAILSDPPKFSVLVNDTQPIFFYCSAPGSCIDQGMVGAINPNATQSLAEQKQLAKQASFMLQPGESWPSESTPDPFTTSALGPTSTSESTSSTSSTTPAPVTVEHHHSSLSGGAIAGIVIGAVAGLMLIGALFYLCGRNHALSDLLGKKREHGAFDENRQSVMSGTTAYTTDPKHISGFTMPRPNSDVPFHPPSHPGSPGLPQYINLHQDPRSPSLRGEYTSLSPVAQRDYMTRSPSPGQVPAYSAIPQDLPQNHYGPHEMPADQGEWRRDPREAGAEPGRVV